MKRSTTYTAILLALFAVFAFTAYAVEPGTDTESPSFVDEDADGICDNYQGGGRGHGRGNGIGAGFVDEDGDGICDNSATNDHFIDEDGDGVCDLHEEGSLRKGRGNGRGHHYGASFDENPGDGTSKISAAPDSESNESTQSRSRMGRMMGRSRR